MLRRRTLSSFVFTWITSAANAAGPPGSVQAGLGSIFFTVNSAGEAERCSPFLDFLPLPQSPCTIILQRVAFVSARSRRDRPTLAFS